VLALASSALALGPSGFTDGLHRERGVQSGLEVGGGVELLGGRSSTAAPRFTSPSASDTVTSSKRSAAARVVG